MAVSHAVSIVMNYGSSKTFYLGSIAWDPLSNLSFSYAQDGLSCSFMTLTL